MSPNEAAARAKAGEFREQHRLGWQPLGDLVALIEQTTGHDVAVVQAETDEHGMSMRDPVSGVVWIGVASTSNPMRQRSTLAHELAHVLFEDWGSDAEVGKRTSREVRADAFARHLLVPVQGLKLFLGDQSDIGAEVLSAVVQRFLVSPAIATIALQDAGYIDSETKARWLTPSVSTRDLATRFGWRDQYASLQKDSERIRAPQRLLSRAIRGYIEGVVSAQTIATLRGMSLDDTLNELNGAGIQPLEIEATAVDADELPEIAIDLSDLDDGETEARTA